MKKVELIFTHQCSECSFKHIRWRPECKECGLSDTLELIKNTSYAGTAGGEILKLSEVSIIEQERIKTGILEFDRVVGGGIIPGSTIFLGGDPGIGKSTIQLQIASNLNKDYPALYVSGEESVQQIKARAERTRISDMEVNLIQSTLVEEIIEKTKKNKGYATHYRLYSNHHL